MAIKFYKYQKLKFSLKLLVSVILLYLVLNYAGFDRVYNELANVKIIYIILSGFLVIATTILLGARWRNIIRIFNAEISIAESVRYTLISFAFGIVTPARLGELIKVKFLNDRTNLGYTSSFLTVAVDKLVEAMSSVAVILAGLLLISLNDMAIYVYSSVLIFIILTILLFFNFEKIIHLLRNFLSKKFKKNSVCLNIDKSIFLTSVALSLLVWFVYILQAFLVFKSLSAPSLSFFMLMFAIPLMTISSFLPISVGGVGIREAVSVYLFSFAGVGAEKSITFSLLYTFIGLGIPAITGSFLYLKKIHRSSQFGGMHRSRGKNWIDYWNDPSLDVDEGLGRNMSIFIKKSSPVMNYGRNDIVLDIGCGSGHLELFLAENVKKIHGLETSEKFLELCGERLSKYKNVYFHKLDPASFTDFSFLKGKKFTKIVCLSVIQYYNNIEDVKKLIMEVKKYSRKGSKFLIADIPIKRNLFYDITGILKAALRKKEISSRFRQLFDGSTLKYLKMRYSKGLLALSVTDIHEIIDELQLNAKILDTVMTTNENRKHLLIEF